MNATKYLKKAIEELSPKKKYPTNVDEQKMLKAINAKSPYGILHENLSTKEIATIENLIFNGLVFETKHMPQEINPKRTYKLTGLGGREIAIMHGY